MVILLPNGVKGQIFPQDHNPPHIHLTYQNEQIVIDLRTGEVLKGDKINPVFKNSLNHVREYLNEYLEHWQTLNN